MKFIDHTTLSVKAGNGGMGCIAFLREKYRPNGGPCGGNGGKGGSIILQVNQQLSTLHDIGYKHLYRAENGSNGSGNNKSGKNGKDIVIQVPPGTIIKNLETKQILKDLTSINETYVLAKGGNGGFGNAHFKTQRQTAPRIANDGQSGEELNVEFELKVLADVGLVGYPNVGKSTFISKVSNARPKIADYPFTTLTPNLGIVKFGDFDSFVMADIPGIILGASSGKGLGNQFLRHIERTKVLVYLVEANSQKIEKDFATLQSELKKHNQNLAERKSILLLTKTDLLLDSDDAKEKKIDEISVIQISSVTGKNISKAIESIVKLIKSNNED